MKPVTTESDNGLHYETSGQSCDQPQPYPRSDVTLSTITRDPIHDHAQPYPRSRSTLSTISRNPAHDHTRPYPRSTVNKIFGCLVCLVTKFNLVTPAREALLRDVKSVKQSLRNTHYQVELGNELRATSYELKQSLS